MRRPLLLANAMAALVILGAVTFQLLHDRDRTIADATADVITLRNALQEQTRQTFTTVLFALNGIAETVDDRDMGSDETYQSLKWRQDSSSGTFAFYILDAAGQLTATSQTSAPDAVDFSAEPIYSAHRDNPSLGLYIAPPRKGRAGYARDKWVVTIGRRINHPNGEFAGVIAAAVSIDFLNNFYETLRMGSGGVVGIAKDDGTAIARAPFSEDHMGKGLVDTKLFHEMLPAGEVGVYRADPTNDIEDGIVAYGRVPGFPVVVYVGVSTEERLADWRRHVVVDGVIGLLAFMVVVGLSGCFIVWHRERHQEQERRVDQLKKLTAISASLLESPDIPTALQRVTDMARELVPSHQAITSLTKSPSMAQAIHALSLSERYEAWKEYDESPNGSGIYRRICETNRSIRLSQSQLESHPNWNGFGLAKDRHPPMRGWLAVPLINQAGENLGLIQLSDRNEGEFNAEDEALLLELAHVTSVAIERLKMAQSLIVAVNEAERLQSEAEAARVSEVKARQDIETILTSIGDAVFAVDEEWRFTYLNPQAEKALNRSGAELLGRNIWDEFPEAVGTEAYKQYHKAHDEKVDVDFRYYFAPLKRWFDVRAFPQNQGGITVYFQDVTNFVAQEERLHQAQKMEAIGQLTGGVAHDFNNLLTVILGNGEAVLADLDKSHPDYRPVSMIVEAAEMAADLTDRLLAFARRHPQDPKPVDVNSLVEKSGALLRRTIGEKFDIRLHLQGKIAKAIVDAGQLQNAILNLAVNARDAMPDGGRLTIETAEVLIDDEYVEKYVYAQPGRYVMIAVTDTGVGMSPEVQKQAFEPFFTTKPVGEGTGLGLSMVFGFVKQSNGHVNIYSEVGHGTVVKLYLPCSMAEAVAENDLDVNETALRGSESVLVVEDDAMVQEYTRSTLMALGYDVDVVADGEAALALINAGRSFDLLLCDVMLGPGENSRHVVDVVSKIMPGIKVLHMSGYTENVIAHNGQLNPDTHLLLKPFRRADLALKIRETLDGAK